MNCEETVFSREEVLKFSKSEIARAQIELLNWAMQLCNTGMTPGMIRLRLYNRLVEVSGDGEKA